LWNLVEVQIAGQHFPGVRRCYGPPGFVEEPRWGRAVSVLKPAIHWREAETLRMLEARFPFCSNLRDCINDDELSSFL
jgi:hypothetical protein